MKIVPSPLKRGYSLPILLGVIALITIAVIVLLYKMIADMDETSHRIRQFDVKASPTNVTAFDLVGKVNDMEKKEVSHTQADQCYLVAAQLETQHAWLPAQTEYNKAFENLRNDWKRGISLVGDSNKAAAILAGIARCLNERGFHTVALKYINSALESDKTNWHLYKVRADIYERLNERAKAIVDRQFANSLRDHPKETPESEIVKDMFGSEAK